MLSIQYLTCPVPLATSDSEHGISSAPRAKVISTSSLMTSRLKTFSGSLRQCSLNCARKSTAASAKDWGSEELKRARTSFTSARTGTGMPYLARFSSSWRVKYAQIAKRPHATTETRSILFDGLPPRSRRRRMSRRLAERPRVSLGSGFARWRHNGARAARRRRSGLAVGRGLRCGLCERGRRPGLGSGRATHHPDTQTPPSQATARTQEATLGERDRRATTVCRLRPSPDLCQGARRSAEPTRSRAPPRGAARRRASSPRVGSTSHPLRDRDGVLAPPPPRGRRGRRRGAPRERRHARAPRRAPGRNR
mmetsp:Transcript_7907/g.24098  ORF Transcript_7907/g.24098 Transcript_7907/m.24098 type:complete len:309 (-) Transcript_7907:267-1193(-)